MNLRARWSPTVKNSADRAPAELFFEAALASHRYALVAKGTVEVFVPNLRHEVVVYQHLAPPSAGNSCARLLEEH